MNLDVQERYRRLESVIQETNSGVDLIRVRAAFEYARNAHGTQLRKDGTEFITHPLATAEILAEIKMFDEDSLCAAFLHDCVEDTGVTHDEIKKLFGEDVANIVDGVTKLTRTTYTSKEEQQMENYRKMLLAMTKDLRVILIKLADRLHNMRTMEYQSEKKQREKALETMEVYAPLAHRLGMQKIKWELEDRSIRYLDPESCEEIERDLTKSKAKDEKFLNTVQETLSARMKEHGVECEIYGRIKHLYSIYRKMYTQKKRLHELLDLYAFRVIIESNVDADCYLVLGFIHEMFPRIPGSFKDYINLPKPNGYKSLHTSLIHADGVTFEVQIRTREMHESAEYGIAAHWKYKEGKGGEVDGEEQLAWIRRQLESQQDSDAHEFLQAMKMDMYADEVVVLTPNGDVVTLPKGATPIDFAYSIHSAVGNRMTGALVNKRMVPYTYVLRSGDIVEIITSNASKGPSRDWLNIIKSTEARNKIRQYFKRERREENIVHGKLMFDGELKRLNIKMEDIMREDILTKALARVSFNNLDDMYAAIGYGGVSTQRVVGKFREELSAVAKANKKEEEIPKKKPQTNERIKPVRGVMVDGMENCLVKFAKCCAPVPGDPIIGFTTRGYGVSVHRQDCENYLKSVAEDASRWVVVTWADTEERAYSTTIQLMVKDRTGILVDVGSALNALNIKISSYNSKNISGVVHASIVVEVKNRDELIRAMARLLTLSDVVDIKRGDG